MATATIICFKDKTNRKGKHQVYIRVIHNRKVTYLGLNLYVTTEEWNFDDHLPTKKHSNYSAVKAFLHRKLAAVDKVILELEDSQQSYSVKDIKQRMIFDKGGASFSLYCTSYIARMNRENRFSNRNITRAMMNHLHTFAGTSNVLFSQIDQDLVKDFEGYLLRKVAKNSAGTYLNKLVIVMNTAIREKVIPKSKQISYSGSPEKTKKRGLSADLIRKIRDLDPDPKSKMFIPLNVFLFMFYNQGINLKDLCLLTWEGSIKGDRLLYSRAKTNADFSIKITPHTQRILDKLQSITGTSKYIFPYITSDRTPADIHQAVQRAGLKINYWLKKIPSMIGYPEINLTTYVSRHSWASIAKSSNVPLAVISDGLGHSNMQITQVYLSRLDNVVIDEANALVTNL